jgi:hypothetical protein
MTLVIAPVDRAVDPHSSSARHSRAKASRPIPAPKAACTALQGGIVEHAVTARVQAAGRNKPRTR